MAASKPISKPSLLNRASNLMQANARKSNLNRISRLTQSRISGLKNQKQNSFIEGRDSTFDVNLSVDDEDGIPGIVGKSQHRCSMIKKYNIETFFSPSMKMHRRATTAEVSPMMPVSRHANFQPVDSTHPINADTSVHQPMLPPDKIDEETDEEQSVTEMVPEVASNLEYGESDETFTICQDNTFKLGSGVDFLSLTTGGQ